MLQGLADNQTVDGQRSLTTSPEASKYVRILSIAESHIAPKALATCKATPLTTEPQKL